MKKVYFLDTSESFRPLALHLLYYALCNADLSDFTKEPSNKSQKFFSGVAEKNTPKQIVFLVSLYNLLCLNGLIFHSTVANFGRCAHTRSCKLELVIFVPHFVEL